MGFRLFLASIPLAVLAQAVRADAGPTSPTASAKSGAKKQGCTIAERIVAAQSEFKNLASTTGFCLSCPAIPLDPALGEIVKELSLCKSAACSGGPKTCSLTLSSTTITIDSATLAFKGTTDVTVKGAASAKLKGIPLSCKELVVTARAVPISGTLALSGQGSSLGLVVSSASVNIDPKSVKVSGCGVIGALANEFASAVVSTLHGPATKALADGIKGPVFGRACSPSGA